MKASVAGVTLIELMIAVLIVGLLALATAPLTASWINEAQLTETQGLLEEAVGRAKSNALRNPGGVSGADTGASALCLDGGQLSLHGAQAPDQPASCNGAAPALWSARLPGDVSLEVDDAPLACLCLNNKGLLSSDAAACGGGCSDSLSLTVSAGSENENFDFY